MSARTYIRRVAHVGLLALAALVGGTCPARAAGLSGAEREHLFPPRAARTDTIHAAAAELRMLSDRLPDALPTHLLRPVPAPREESPRPGTGELENAAGGARSAEAGWRRICEAPVLPPAEMGHRYFARGEFEKAAECYAKALETDGPHSHLAVMHALCTRRLGRLKSADNGFKKLAGEGESRAGWTRWVEEIERIITSVKGAEDER